MPPRGRMPFGMGMGMEGLADMIAGMMGSDSSGMSGISIDPSMMNEYPQWIQDSIRRGDGSVKKERSAQETMDKIALVCTKNQLEKTTEMLYSMLLRVEGLKERLAEKDADAAEAEKQRREQIAGLRKDLREARQMINIKADAHKVRLKVVQGLRAENKSLKANLAAAVEGHAELKDLIDGIDISANKPDLVEMIKTLKSKISGNGADMVADGTDGVSGDVGAAANSESTQSQQ